MVRPSDDPPNQKVVGHLAGTLKNTAIGMLGSDVAILRLKGSTFSSYLPGFH
jgi:hypothetical protein